MCASAMRHLMRVRRILKENSVKTAVNGAALFRYEAHAFYLDITNVSIEIILLA